MYMLDTDICIYVLKNHSKKLRHKFNVTKDICISSVTYGELRFGIEFGEPSVRADRMNQLDLFAQRLLVESWGEEAAKHYGYIRSLLKKQGNLIGNNDLLIASHALSIGAVMVTNNVREFGRVPDLITENWFDL